ncbi:MAG: hypothetical protein ACOY46_08690 [Bacillota bacterium]
MAARELVITTLLILLLLLGFPVYSFAAGEHSSHGPLPAAGDNTYSPGQDQAHQENSHDSHESGQGGHNEAGSESTSGHGEDSSGHGEDSSGHGKSGSDMSDQTKNIIVGGFTGVNALVIGIALYLRNKSQGGLNA